MLDHLITELNTRCDAASSPLIIEFMCLLPSLNTTTATDSESGESSLVNILQLYEDDLPSPVTFNTPEKALAFADSDFYPNI